jgi:hypothetical protein
MRTKFKRTRSHKTSHAWRGRRSPEDDARRLLHFHGFTTYRNERNGYVVVCHFGRMFVFEYGKAREFLDWTRTKKSGLPPIATLPAGLKICTSGNRQNIESTAKPRNPHSRPTTPTKNSGRSFSAIEGSHSTVPGHYAELDWNDLRKRR